MFNLAAEDWGSCLFPRNSPRHCRSSSAVVAQPLREPSRRRILVVRVRRNQEKDVFVAEETNALRQQQQRQVVQHRQEVLLPRHPHRRLLHHKQQLSAALGAANNSDSEGFLGEELPSACGSPPTASLAPPVVSPVLMPPPVPRFPPSAPVEVVCFKALCLDDPHAYVLRLIALFPISSFDLVKAAVKRWAPVSSTHPNIVPLRQAFATADLAACLSTLSETSLSSRGPWGASSSLAGLAAGGGWEAPLNQRESHVGESTSESEEEGRGGTLLGGPPRGGSSRSSVVFVFDYYPNAYTLEERFVGTEEGRETPSEKVLWSVALQILMALQHIHNNQLAYGALYPSKVLVTHRLRDCDVPSGLRMLMSDRSYSSEFKSFCCSLLSGASRRSLSYSASSLLEAYAAQALPLLEEEVSVGDRYESLLFAEMSRSRAFLLLCKLCFVVERGQLGAESNWSEVGDRYIARLFRDYLFFQQGAEGEPILDIAHVWDSVFKCDLGTAETAVLMSRDGASVLLLPFRDIKTSIDKSFRELVAAAAHGPTVAAATAVAAVSTPPAAASSPSHGPTTADAGAVAAAAVATRPPTMQAYSPLHHTPMGSMYPLQQQQQHSPPMYCLDTLGLYGPPMQPVQHSLQQHTHFPQEQQHSSFGPLNWQQQVLQMQPQKQQR
ncbi:PAN3 related protein [Cyclospora cayetanensis]|uniref:PAN3 related protein n=1 Tax=Cyclospora cayetanensis TaxID=88456 RepID=A0A1D3D1G0_9EIME|nr:PAN3 related protein [Cyclospora cayetanensis]